MPDRESFGGYLGPVGYATGWILATESESVALIIGLVGFGLFGALVSSFIRTDRNRSRRHNFLSILDAVMAGFFGRPENTMVSGRSATN